MEKFTFQEEEYIAINIGEVPRDIKNRISSLTQKKASALATVAILQKNPAVISWKAI